MDVGSIARQVFSILLVFGLLGFTLWKLRRGGNPAAIRAPWRARWGKLASGGRAMESLERLPLTPQHALHLIRVHGRELVVATHPQGCTFLENTALKNSTSDAAEGAGA